MSLEDSFGARPRSVVTVAQLVEPWTVTPVVAGSNPVSHPTISPNFPYFYLSFSASASIFCRYFFCARGLCAGHVGPHPQNLLRKSQQTFSSPQLLV